MSPIDGAISMKIDINHPQTISNNISKDQPSKASGLGGVRLKRQKSAAVLYKYRYGMLINLKAVGMKSAMVYGSF